MPENIIRIRIVDQRPGFTAQLAKTVAAIATMVGVFWGPGLLLDSAAMQWAGFIAFWGLVAFAVSRWNDLSMTIQEARAKLDELEIQDQS